MSDIAIRVENVSKKYAIGAKASGSLRETLVNKWNVLTGKTKAETEEFWALKDVSFEVKQGEVLGIIGKNGAGKSTLLKVLSRITEPTSGKITINGRVSSLLEVGTGFHPELTGRENIFLNGTILGMTRKEVKQKFDEIVDFSGVEKFIDTPVKHYSSGMYVRLAFAVAAHLEPEILIIDEVLAVGDAEFQKKCLGKMGEIAKGGRTVLFVSHNMGAIKNLCNKTMFIDGGKNSSIEDNYIAIEKYLTSISNTFDKKEEIKEFIINYQKGEFKVEKIILLCDSRSTNRMYSGCNFAMDIYIDNPNMNTIDFGFSIIDKSGNHLITIGNINTGKILKHTEKNIICTIEIPYLSLYEEGIYMMDFYAGNFPAIHTVLKNICCFYLSLSNVFRGSVPLDPNYNKFVVKDVDFKIKSDYIKSER